LTKYVERRRLADIAVYKTTNLMIMKRECERAGGMDGVRVGRWVRENAHRRYGCIDSKTACDTTQIHGLRGGEQESREAAGWRAKS
jgi:hypothetical protein